MKVYVKLGCNPGFMKLMLSVLAFFSTIQAQTVSGTVPEAGERLLVSQSRANKLQQLD